MTFTREQLVDLVSYKLKDRGQDDDREGRVLLSNIEIGQELDAAVYQYSVDFPRQVTADVAGTDTAYYSLSALAGWIPSYSTLFKVEYPLIDPTLDDQQTDPTFLVMDKDIDFYQSGLVDYIRFRDNYPATGSSIRLVYTTVHALTNESNTLPVHHKDAIANLCASFCCRRLEAMASGSSNVSISAMGSDYRDAQLRYRQTMEDFENAYRRAVGLPLIHNGQVQPDSIGRGLDTRINWGTRTSWNQDWLIHGDRYR